MLVFGGIIFWIIIAAIIITIICSIERDHETYLALPLVILIGAGIVLYFSYKSAIKPIFYSVSGMEVLYFSIGYLVAGLIWSFFKWFRLVRRKALVYRKDKEKADEKMASYERDIAANPNSRSYKPEVPDVEYYKPKASNEVDQITAWIVLWPFSLLRYLIGNFLVDFFNNLVRMFSGVYNSITNSQFK